MNIVTSQKTTTVFDADMDSADVKDLLTRSLREKLNVPVDYPGVTVSVDLLIGADGEIRAKASLAVETSTVTPQAPAEGEGVATEAGAVLNTRSDLAPAATDTPAPADADAASTPGTPSRAIAPALQFPKAA